MRDSLRTLAAIAAAGFRRFSTYRQAMLAGAFTNTAFGFLRCYVLLSVAGAAGTVAGYDRAQLATYVWLGQGLLAVVNAWGMLDLADRVRSGDVVGDLLRPVDPLWTYLATDIGRAGYAALTRFVVPVTVGLAVFDLYFPAHPVTYPLFLGSAALAVVVAFAGRYLVGLTAFWLLDVRGVEVLWICAAGLGSGLYFPLPILPGWLVTALWVATPFPAMLQGPLDVAVERGGQAHSVGIVAIQAVWVVVMLLCCRLAQAIAWRKLVVQGG